VLDELIVRNLAVLEEARLEPGGGLTVVTGETGTGKTLLLGALRLLLGQSAPSSLVGPFADEASVEGRFLLPDGTEVAAGRRLARAGRSRAYLDGSIASAAALEAATDGLVEIIGQHDQLNLTRPAEARALVDRRLDDAGRSALGAYRARFEAVRALRSDRGALGGDRRALERELELLRHQVREIESAGIAPGDDERLDALLGRLRNVEAVRALLSSASDGLDLARDGIGAAVGALRRAAALDPSVTSIAEEVGAAEDRLGESAIDLRSMAEELESDPAALEEAEARRRAVDDLRRKYGATIPDVLEFADAARARADEIDGLLTRADRVDADLARADAALDAAGEELRAHRGRAAEALADDAIRHLTDLGFVDPSLVADIDVAEPGPAGADAVTLRFASDRRLEAGDLARVASGGELSRLVLSLRLAGGAGSASTLAFDEIDAGVGGATALELGRKLAALSAGRQVLCVTHLPQVAAFADTHYVVERSGHAGRVRRVEGSGRVAELSRMLAGLPDSERGQEAAEELLDLARTR
jgi:DNA repair protein RecN (Recombination protein N)